MDFSSIANIEDFKTGDRSIEIKDDYTIEATIESGAEKEVTEYTTSILRKLGDDLEYPISNILDDYLDELKVLSIVHEMSDAEFRRYNMRPDLLAYDIYGDKDLDFILLAINGINKDSDFNKKTIRILDPEDFEEILEVIMEAGEEVIESNRLSYENTDFY